MADAEAAASAVEKTSTTTSKPKTTGKKKKGPPKKEEATTAPRKSSPDAATPTTKRKKKSLEASVKDHEASVPGAITDAQAPAEVAPHHREVGDEPEPSSDPVTKMSEEEMREQEEMEFPTEIITEQGKSPKPATPPQVDEFEDRDFDNLDPKDYGINFDETEMVYEPPDRDDTLPDLYRLMDSLDDGGGDLEGDLEPPSLFTQPEHVPNYKKISELKLEMEEEEVDPYLEQFEDGIRDDVLMIGSISLEEVQAEELRLRDEHIAYQDQEANVARHRKQEIVLREEEAKRRIAKELKEKRRLIKRRLELLQQKERLMMDRLHKSFRRAENQLCSTLENRKGEVRTMFGDLTLGEGHYGGNRGRRWKVDWDSTPQPIQIKLKTLRGTKDKLPAGRYVLSVSLYNRLGGHVMRWSNLKGQQWGGTTLPLPHDGHFYNSEIKIDQSVFTVLPSRPGIRPGMTLVFELFLLRGAVVPTDRVVAWGCFPIADAKFDVIEGKFKSPFLRGEMDVKIDKHDKIEELMSSDMDNWISNLYFEIIKLPRYLAGQKEYEVELQFSSALLNFPDRYNTNGEEYRDGEAPIPGSLPDINVMRENKENMALETQSSSGSRTNDGPGTSQNSGSDGIVKPLGSYYDLKRPSSSTSQASTGSRMAITQGETKRRRPMTTIGSHAIHKKKVMIGEESDSDEYDEEDVYVGKAGDGFFPVKGHPGMYYKQYRTNAVEDYHQKLYTLLPRTALLTKRQRRKRLTYLEQLEEHTYSVKEPFSDKGHTKEESMEKMQYVGRQLLAELGLSQWRSREFWTMMVMFVLLWFVRIYGHYIGQWIFLQARVIPINKFVFYPYTVNLNYQPTLLNPAEEAAVVLLGPFTNIFILSFFVFVCWVIQRIFGNFPDIGSKFIVVYGIHTFLDPFLIALVDTALQRWEDVGGDVPIGDYAKVYWNFYRSEGTGIAGIFLTVFMYICTCFASGTITYMYFLRLHNNGRMLDIYWRLHGQEEVFFVPYDLEISNQELDYIVRKAEQWRGEEGERRKIGIYDYIWEEETVEETIWDENGVEKKEVREGKQEVTTHVAIHTLHLDGLRELYRHFLRLPDGGIVEVFGDMTVAGMDKDITVALAEGVNEDLGSQTHLNKVPGRETAYTNAGFNLEEDDDHVVKQPSIAGSISSLKKMS